MKSAQFRMIAYASDIDTSNLSVVNQDGKTGVIEDIQATWVTIEFPEDGDAGTIAGPLGALAVFTVSFAFFLLMLKQLLEILKTVENRDPFVPENAKRVRIVGLILIFGTLFKSLVLLVLSGYADVTLTPSGLNFNGHLGVDPLPLIGGLSVLAFSEVFRHGNKMREEQELTV